MTDLRQKIQRLLLVISYARSRRGARVADVARAVGMTPEELKASVPALSLIGKPPFSPDDLVDISIEGDRIYVELDQSLGRPLRLTQQEWLALAIALRALAASGAGDTAETARAILDKLKGLGDGGAAELERRFAIEAEDPAQVAEKFRVLEAALREQRAVEIVYYTASRDELSARTLQPYALIHFVGSWYAVGHDSRRGEVRIFKVERIREARLTDERFAPPAGFDAQKYARGRMAAADSAGVARVRFRPPAARLVAEDHPPERVQRLDDGSLELKLDYAHPEWVAGWVLSFGDAAEVLEPDEVRAAVAARCRDALAHYH